MSKFDIVFEKAMCKINEKEYINSTFQDNISLMVKSLGDNDYLPKNVSTEDMVNSIMGQDNNVKEITLTTQDQAVPPTKILMSQDNDDSESFSVTIVNVKDPTQQKQFKNSMLETIFDDVLTYIKTSSMENISPDSAVDKLPPTEGAEAQPEGGESELPIKPPTA